MIKAAHATKAKLVKLVVSKANDAIAIATDINERTRIFGLALKAIGPIIREHLQLSKATK